MLSKYLSIQKSVVTGETVLDCSYHEDIRRAVDREREELDALRYYVIKLTWDIEPAAGGCENKGEDR